MRHLQAIRQVRSSEFQEFSEKDSIVRLPQSSLIIRMNKLPPNADLVPTERHHFEAKGSVFIDPLNPLCIGN